MDVINPILNRPWNHLQDMKSEAGHLIYEGSAPRKTLLIVFAYINQQVGTRSHSSFLSGIDCKKLFLNPGQNTWYQTGIPGVASSYAELGTFLAAVKQAHWDHEILCLGHSMGGFGALGFGLHIGADRILASVPEYVLNRPGSVSVRHMSEVSIRCGDLSEMLARNTDSRITILVGSKNSFDVSMAEGIAALTPAEIIRLNSDHGTFPYLRDHKKLGPLLEAFVNGDPLQPIVTGL